MFDLKICDLQTTQMLIPTWATKTISLLDPGTTMHWTNGAAANHCILHFNDVHKVDGINRPHRDSLKAILAYGKTFTDDDRVLVHCHAGQSRSTAAAIALLIDHGMAYQAAFEYVQAVRPILWPNSLLIAYADEHFGLGGALVALVRDFKAGETGRLWTAKPLSAAAIEDTRHWLALLTEPPK